MERRDIADAQVNTCTAPIRETVFVASVWTGQPRSTVFMNPALRRSKKQLGNSGKPSMMEYLLILSQIHLLLVRSENDRRKLSAAINWRHERGRPRPESLNDSAGPISS